MWWVLLLIVLGGCDQLFDLRTVGSDRGDGGLSFDPKCPAPGQGPPIFDDALHEVVSRYCTTYSASVTTGRAFAYCVDGLGTVEEGPIDGALSPAAISTMPAGEFLSLPALAPEGDVVYVKQSATTGRTYRIVAYQRSGSGWVFKEELASGTDDLYVGVPSAAPKRRIMLSISSQAAIYRELSDESGSWVEVRSGSWSEIKQDVYLGVAPNLSVDGLRLTFGSENQVVYYAERASLDLPFKDAVPLAGLDHVRDAFVTPDCGRVYFGTAGALVFRTQAP